MRILRLTHEGAPRYARLVDDSHAKLWTRAPWDGGSETADVVSVTESALLAPVEPSKIVCVGRNYRAHAKELGNEVPAEPLLFLKPPTALSGPGATIPLPAESARVEHEGELAVVVARRLVDATPDEALAAVFGYTCANDVTARDLQRKDVQFTRAKSFDGFCPVGPHVETDVSPADLQLVVRVNGEVRQDGRTRDLVFPVGELLAYISRVMTLLPGDLVLTGTPAGVGPLVAGDRVEVTIDGIGTLVNSAAPRPIRTHETARP
jgi:2-keto-4-pentenoate hydratase/2-oxohepta-3-ene-1,7-dioic acid hydratase in catechol pathway